MRITPNAANTREKGKERGMKEGGRGEVRKERKKGKERMYLYSAFIVATTLKALRRGSHSFTCK